MIDYQLIVCLGCKGVDNIEIKIKSEKKEVNNFLKKLNCILRDQNFDIDNNFTIIRSKKEEMQYSTKFTMADLDYNASDIVEQLKELTIEVNCTPCQGHF